MQHNCGLNIAVCGQTLGSNLALSLITCVNLLTTSVFNLIVENRFDFEKGNVPRTPEIIPHTGVTTLPTNTTLVM